MSKPDWWGRGAIHTRPPKTAHDNSSQPNRRVLAMQEPEETVSHIEQVCIKATLPLQFGTTYRSVGSRMADHQGRMSRRGQQP